MFIQIRALYKNHHLCITKIINWNEKIKNCPSGTKVIIQTLFLYIEDKHLRITFTASIAILIDYSEI